MSFITPLIIAACIIALAVYIISKRKSKQESSSPHANYTIDDIENMRQNEIKKRIDAILEKVNKYGIKSLSVQEQKALNDYSQKK